MFLYDVLVCTHCGGPRRLLTFVSDRDAIERILPHLGLPPNRPNSLRPDRRPNDRFTSSDPDFVTDQRTLPKFVHDLLEIDAFAASDAKLPASRVTQKMETPVIYFYSDEPLRATCASARECRPRAFHSRYE